MNMDEAVRKTVYNTKLADSPPETWANTILYQLAIALGYKPHGHGDSLNDPNLIINADPDEVLKEALQAIEAAKEDGF